jgi:hypothetical protein
MIHGIVKKIMMTGLNKYAKKFNQSSDNVQIKVSITEEGHVKYEMCNDFSVVETVTFLEIMDKKIDFFGYEQLATPFLGQCIVNFSEEANVSPLEANAFILKHKEQIFLSYYVGNKNVKNVTLAKQLESLGVGI